MAAWRDFPGPSATRPGGSPRCTRTRRARHRTYRHVDGITRRMDVRWEFLRSPGGTTGPHHPRVGGSRMAAHRRPYRMATTSSGRTSSASSPAAPWPACTRRRARRSPAGGGPPWLTTRGPPRRAPYRAARLTPPRTASPSRAGTHHRGGNRSRSLLGGPAIQRSPIRRVTRFDASPWRSRSPPRSTTSTRPITWTRSQARRLDRFMPLLHRGHPARPR
jgi:hypothetical protein